MSLHHFPLRELHIGATGHKPDPHPLFMSNHRAFHKAGQEAVAGSPARLGLALLRGTRERPSSEEARVLLRHSERDQRSALLGGGCNSLCKSSERAINFFRVVCQCVESFNDWLWCQRSVWFWP